jgi:hypothetical protein
MGHQSSILIFQAGMLACCQVCLACSTYQAVSLTISVPGDPNCNQISITVLPLLQYLVALVATTSLVLLEVQDPGAL